MSGPVDSIVPGARIGERFEVGERAAAGGMGAVFVGRDRQSGARVAIKVLRTRALDDRARFLREVSVLGELHHPGIVGYIDHGDLDDDSHYLVMDWIEGETLEQRLGRGPLPIEESLGLVEQLADALAAVHQRGVVHRDLKPANVILSPDLAHPKLIDFGVARRIVEHLTRTGTLIGTPTYMAPEQIRGMTAIDARADVFALGCLLFKCVSGVDPFAGKNLMAVRYKILFCEYPRLETMHAGARSALGDFVARLLARDPDGRPADAAALLPELRNLRAGLSRPSEARDSAHRLPNPVATALLACSSGNPEALIAESPAADELRRRVREIAAAHHGAVEFAGDGSFVLRLLPDGDRVERALQCAAALSRELTDAVLVLSSDLEAARAIDAGAATLAAEAMSRLFGDEPEERPQFPALRVDPSALTMVSGRSELVHHTAGFYLRLH